MGIEERMVVVVWGREEVSGKCNRTFSVVAATLLFGTLVKRQTRCSQREAKHTYMPVTVLLQYCLQKTT